MIYTVTLNPALDRSVEIPDFAPGAVNRIAAQRMDPGGKGVNVSKLLAHLGCESYPIIILAGHTGQLLEAALKKAGLSGCFLYTDGETRTNLKITDSAQQVTTEINAPGIPVPPVLLERLLEALTKDLQAGDLVVLSGSLPPNAPADTYRRWTEACQGKGARVLLDADGAALAEGIAAAPELIKPNQEELSRLLGRSLDTPEVLAEAAYGLLIQYGIRQVVVSMGHRGALYVSQERTVYTEGLAVPVRCTTGAGDSVVAALAYAAQNGFPWEEAVRFASAAGAASVMCSGTRPADMEQISALMPRVKLHVMR